MTPFVEGMVWFLGITSAAELSWKGYKWCRDRNRDKIPEVESKIVETETKKVLEKNN